MIVRILALVIIAGALGGFAWLSFRDTPQKKAVRLRQAVEFFLNEAEDLSAAEKACDRLMELAPSSTSAMRLRAQILERRGSVSDLDEALKLYERIIALEGAAALNLHLNRIAIFRLLGRLPEAQGAAVSIMDAYPFHATIELGRVAMATLAPLEAIKHFQRALTQSAKSDEERAVAYQELAQAYALIVDINLPAIERAAGEDPGGDTRRAEFVEEAKRRYLHALGKALDHLTRVAEQPQTKLTIRQDIAELHIMRARFSPPAETPFYDAVKALQNRIDVKDAVAEDLPPTLAVRMGMLRLNAACLEKDRLPDRSEAHIAELLATAQRNFEGALGGLSVEAAKELLNYPPAIRAETASSEEPVLEAKLKQRRSYINSLGLTARAFLGGPLSSRLLDDPSPLRLSERIADARESSDPVVAGSFSGITGIAQVKTGKPDAARPLLDRFLELLPPGARPQAALAIAEQCMESKSAQPLVLDYFERAGRDSPQPLDLLGPRIRLLRRLLADKDAEPEAQRRLDDLIEKATASVTSPTEYASLAQILQSVRGRDAVEKLLRTGVEKFPSDYGLRFNLAGALLVAGAGHERGQDKDAASKAYQEALSHYLALLISFPAEAHNLGLQSRYWLDRLETEFDLKSLAPLIQKSFAAAEAASIEPFAEGLRLFLRAEFPAALEKLNAVASPKPFEPFLSLLAGYCHIEAANEAAQRLAALGGAPSAAAGAGPADLQAGALRSEVAAALARAREAFSRHPDFIVGQAEVLNLEVEDAIHADRDVSEDLFSRLKKLADDPRVDKQGQWILARAYEQQFRRRFMDLNVKNSELGRILVRMQTALRTVIERQPRFTTAYHKLADSLLLSERLDETLERAGAKEKRELFKPDYAGAIHILESALSPTVETVRRLAVLHVLNGEPAQARRYNATLCLVQPVGSNFEDLVKNCLSTGEAALVARISAAETEAPPTSAEHKEAADAFRAQLGSVLVRTPAIGGQQILGVLALLAEADRSPRRDVVYQSLATDFLRLMFQKLPEADGLRPMFRGLVLSLDEAKAKDSPEKLRLRREMISAYEQALQAFESKKLASPLLLLNNLAWFLAEADDESSRKRGLELAERARDMVVDPEGRADVLDTYAWALLRNQRLVEAREAYRKILNSKESPTYRYHYARVLFELKAYDEAKEEIQKALDSDLPFEQKLDGQRLKDEIVDARRKVLGESFEGK
jgi:tetratricopeptide (TPR) repeat protein/predicted DNA-binding protein